MTTAYRFHVRGHLDGRWSEWLGGLAIEQRTDGTSVISGPVADQAALHGVIARIRDLGLPLLAVDCAGDTCAEVLPSAQPEARGSPFPPDDAFDPLHHDLHSEPPATDIEGDPSCD